MKAQKPDVLESIGIKSSAYDQWRKAIDAFADGEALSALLRQLFSEIESGHNLGRNGIFTIWSQLISLGSQRCCSSG
jgi:hypothetical protein